MSRAASDSELRERRLSAILAADVVGYSKLMGIDEVGTLRSLNGHRRELIEPTVTGHRGRIVKTTGDGMLVEFASAVDAVRCAVDVQRGMAERNEAEPPERRIEFRIGINVGDIIGVGDDIYGDGVNVAARLEAMSEPGGIYVSRTVRDPVRDKLAFTFEDLGEISAKNIARPIHVFRVRHDTEVGRRNFASRRAVRRFVIVVVAALVVVGVSAGAWFWRNYTSGTAPPPLSLVVLPFDDLGGDTLDNKTVDSITEDLTTLFAQTADFSVIARNSAFTVKDKMIDIKRVGETFGVRYAVEGSVHQLEDKLRVNAQLISTETGTHIWADHFDTGPNAASSGIDDIGRHIWYAVIREIINTDAERSAHAANPGAMDFLLQARALQLRPQSPERQAEVVGLFERAVQLDAFSANALAGLAEALLDSNFFTAEDPAVPSRLRRAEELVTKAELLHPQYMKVMWARVFLLGSENRCDELIPAAKRTIEAYPALSGAYYRLGLCQMWSGQGAEAIRAFEQALRVDPGNLQNFNRYYSIGYALVFLGRYEEALPWYQRSLAANPSNSVYQRGNLLAAITAARALAGQTEQDQGRLGSKMQELTHGDRKLPIVAMGWNAERYQGRNLALRLVALGYAEVYWYRGGREAWEAAGLPETELVMQDW